MNIDINSNMKSINKYPHIYITGQLNNWAIKLLTNMLLAILIYELLDKYMSSFIILHLLNLSNSSVYQAQQWQNLTLATGNKDILDA